MPSNNYIIVSVVIVTWFRFWHAFGRDSVLEELIVGSLALLPKELILPLNYRLMSSAACSHGRHVLLLSTNMEPTSISLEEENRLPGPPQSSSML